MTAVKSEVRGAAYTSPGSVGYSSVSPFTTLTPDTTAPTISGIAWSAVDKNNVMQTVIKDGYDKMEDVYKNVPKDQWPKQ